MQLRFNTEVLKASDALTKVTAIAWSPNTEKLAVVTTDRVVQLFDDNAEKKDKFKTKAGDPNTGTNYLVRGLAFSPDSTKLAVAQSDNIIFVYRLGTKWGEKKSICNKFPQPCSITAVCWPNGRETDIVFGLSDGWVKLGSTKNNKPYTLYQHPKGSYVVTLASNPTGMSVYSGHTNNSIYAFNFGDDGVAPGHAHLCDHSCVPYGLAASAAGVCAAGNDLKVAFYDTRGAPMQEPFDFSSQPELREFTCAAINPGGDAVAVGCWDGFLLFTYSQRDASWSLTCTKRTENFYSTTALAWKSDGSRLALGSLTGAVDSYDACLRRSTYKGKFEFTYVSSCSVIVRTIKTNQRIVLKSVFGYEIEATQVYRDRFLVAHTPETLLLGDLESCKLSEVEWQFAGTEKFHFENERICMVYRDSELALVEYGNNDILGTVRTEAVSPYLLSCVVNEAKGEGRPARKRMAYLVDQQTAQIVDLLNNNMPVATVSHDLKIDWLELNQRGTHLLFRDKRAALHLYDIESEERHTLLTVCGYVQFVPESDVVVAQSRSNLCVWYSIGNPDQQTVVPIKGEVTDIERQNNRTEVIVDEGISTMSYALDESLIYFGAALEERDYERAIAVLDPLELNAETEAQWQALAEVALADNMIAVAERCYAAQGDVARARYLRSVAELARNTSDETGSGYDSAVVRARLALLHQQWMVAENLLLGAGRVDDVITMYTDAHKWSDAIRVADQMGHAEADSLRSNHFQWLLATNQEEAAGAVKEEAGEPFAAIELYLKGGLPARAALVVMRNDENFDPALLDSICASLSKAGLHERAGELFEHLGRSSEALEAYRRGHAYRRAVDLARREFPGEVTGIEDQWGDHLMQQKQMEAAINHFIEAGQSSKAIEAAFQCRQWAKAAGIVESLPPPAAAPYLRRLATQFEASKHYSEAERFYVRAGAPGDAVEMYSAVGRWDAANKVAMGYLSDDEVHALYTRRAREQEAEGRFKEAEKLYLQVQQADAAIHMYKKNKMYNDMIRLVSQFRKDLLTETHVHLAEACEGEGNLKSAEKHYCDAQQWKQAVQMYRANNMWEDSLRVAKVYGGVNASKQVAYAWAVSLGGEEGAKLLKKLGLVEYAIDYAVECGDFVHAFALTRASAKAKLPEVHLKYAMFLEDEGRFKEAEDEFVNAAKPKEAIDMYIHQQDWDAAMNVAEKHDPSSTADILVAHARVRAEAKEHAAAEGLYLKAKRPELALAMYREAQMWDDALRVAEDYLPSKVPELNAEMASALSRAPAGGRGDGGGSEAAVQRGKMLERAGDHARAIEAYLQLTAADVGPTQHDALQSVWENAVHLAQRHQPYSAPDVVATVASRLADIGRHEAAGDLHLSIQDVQAAVRAYCGGRMFDKARQVAGANQSLLDYVTSQEASKGPAPLGPAEPGATASGAAPLNTYAAQGNWDKVHELAALEGPETAAKWVIKHCNMKVKQEDWPGAAQVLSQHGAPPEPGQVAMYRHIASRLLSLPAASRSVEGEEALWEFLQRLRMEALRAGAQGGDQLSAQDRRTLTRCFEAAHLTHMMNKCTAAGFGELAARQATARLRYIDIMAADRAFHEAGMLWKEAGRLNMAFVLLNRFLDLAEAMEEADPSGGEIENSDFVNTDIPYDFAIPEVHWASEDQREEVRELVLSWSMEPDLEQSLSLRTCDACGADTYEAALTCHECRKEWPSCAVTGYPISGITNDKVESKGNPDVVARREDWNVWVGHFHVCPITGTVQSAAY